MLTEKGKEHASILKILKSLGREHDEHDDVTQTLQFVTRLYSIGSHGDMTTTRIMIMEMKKIMHVKIVKAVNNMKIFQHNTEVMETVGIINVS